MMTAHEVTHGRGSHESLTERRREGGNRGFQYQSEAAERPWVDLRSGAYRRRSIGRGG